jgi:hypothetical protein
MTAQLLGDARCRRQRGRRPWDAGTQDSLQQPFHTIPTWDEQVGPNGKDGKIDRRLPLSGRPFSPRTRSPWIRLSGTSQRARKSAGVAAGPVRVALGSIPRPRPARRRTGPGSTSQRICRLPCDLRGGAVLLSSSSGALRTGPRRQAAAGGAAADTMATEGDEHVKNPRIHPRIFDDLRRRGATPDDRSKRKSLARPTATVSCRLNRTHL